MQDFSIRCSSAVLGVSLLGVAACDESLDDGDVDAAAPATGKADVIEPIDTGNGTLVVRLPEGAPPTGRLVLNWGSTGGPPVHLDESIELAATNDGCLYIKSTPHTDDHLYSRYCGIVIAEGEVTEVALAVIVPHASELAQVTAGPDTHEFELRGQPLELGALSGGWVDVTAERPYVIAPGTLRIKLGSHWPALWPGMFEQPWSVWDVTLDEGDVLEPSLPDVELRASVRIQPPPSRALPDPFAWLDCEVGTVFESRQDSAQRRWPLQVTEDFDLRYFPVDELEANLIVNGFRVPFEQGPGDATELQLFRLDVGDVQTSSGRVKGSFSVERIADGAMARQICERPSWFHTQFSTGYGLDLPAGEYRVRLRYTTPAGESKEQIHIVELGPA